MSKNSFSGNVKELSQAFSYIDSLGVEREIKTTESKCEGIMMDFSELTKKDSGSSIHKQICNLDMTSMARGEMNDLMEERKIYRANSACVNNKYILASADQGAIPPITKQLAASPVILIEKKPKSCCTSEKLHITNDGNFVIKTFDDANSVQMEFFLEPINFVEIYKIKSDFEVNGMHMICFKSPRNTYTFAGKFDKNIGKKLYERILDLGIPVNSKFSKNRQQDILQEFFAPMLSQCKAELQICDRAGWYKNNFLDASNCGYMDIKQLECLPIMQKNFWSLQERYVNSQKYFQTLCNIRNYRERLILSLFPFAGMLASIFCEEKLRIPTALNFVMLTQRNIIPFLSHLIQIFNRNTIEICSCTNNAKSVNDLLACAKDEIVQVGAFVYKGETSYRKKCIKDAINRIQHELFEFDYISNKASYAVAFYSNYQMNEATITDIFVGDDFLINTEQDVFVEEYDAFINIFLSFVKYVSINMDLVRTIIKRNSVRKDRKQMFWVTMLEIVQMFWTEQKIDFLEQLGLSQIIDIMQLFEDDFETEEWSEKAISSIRRCMPELRAISKNKCKELNKRDILYTEKYIWIYPLMFDEILQSTGLLNHKSQILNDLKCNGMLIVDSEGLTRRLQVGGVRVETYQFVRNAFNHNGLVDVISLAEEVIE